MNRTLLIGTYPAAGQGAPTGQGEGIWRIDLNSANGHLGEPHQLARTPAPSFLAEGRPGAIFAVNEECPGAISSWSWTPDSLTATGSLGSGGDHPCHVRPVSDDVVVATNYTSGSVAAVHVDAVDGVDRTIALRPLTGSGPITTRQEGPHAHQVIPSPDSRCVLITDLGADRVWRFRLVGDDLVPDGIAAKLPSGTGPRHGAFGAEDTELLIVGELDGQLHSLAWDASSHTGTWRASTPACDCPEPALAHVEVHVDLATVGCRGCSRILELQRHPSGWRRTRAMELPGAWPRHHTTVDGWLVVALQRGNGVAVLSADGRVVAFASVPSPSCILPLTQEP